MKTRITELKWGFIFMLMTLVWMLIERLVGLHTTYIDQHYIYTNIYAIPSILVYVFALREKKYKDYEGSMNYMQGFVSGAIVTLVVTILSPLTQYITTTFIATDYFPNIIAHTVATGKMTQENAELYFSLKSYIFQGLIGAPVMGLITTAIVAIFTKTK